VPTLLWATSVLSETIWALISSRRVLMGGEGWGV
jgi:hypothetical protein